MGFLFKKEKDGEEKQGTLIFSKKFLNQKNALQR